MSERKYVSALGEIDRMASALGLPTDIKETGSMLYRKAMEKGLIKGRNVEAVASAILYIVCRQYNVPRTLGEIAAVSRASLKEIARTSRFILRELNIKLSPAFPIDFVPRFCSKLRLSEEVKAKAVEIIKEAMEKGLDSGRGPVGIVAGAIYLAAILNGTYRTQKKISEVAGVTEVTIRNTYRELLQKSDNREVLEFIGLFYSHCRQK